MQSLYFRSRLNENRRSPPNCIWTIHFNSTQCMFQGLNLGSFITGWPLSKLGSDNTISAWMAWSNNTRASGTQKECQAQQFVVLAHGRQLSLISWAPDGKTRKTTTLPLWHFKHHGCLCTRSLFPFLWPLQPDHFCTSCKSWNTASYYVIGQGFHM